MDPVTHGLTGAVAVQSLADSNKHRPAALTAIVAALMPDIEIFIHHPSDPLFNLEIHRQFTHSFVFTPIGALLVAVLLWWFMRKHLDFREIYLFSLIGYATHGMIDAVTSYGTELMWPFLDTRYSWNLVSIVDPVLTVGLLLLGAVAFYYRSKLPAWLALIWLIFYLTIGLVQRERGKSAIYELVDQRGHSIERIAVKPSIGNLILWRGTYVSNDTVYVDAVRSGLFSTPEIYPGESAPLILPERDYAAFENTVLFDDLHRFARFSDGYLVRHPEYELIIGDGRYSMLPNSLLPLWGIKADTNQPDRHTPFMHFRESGPEIRVPFFKMLTGEK